MELQSKTKKQAKLCLLGDVEVGKTSIMLRLVSDTFEEQYNNTVGASFKSKPLDIGSEIIELHIWDTAGQERYRSLMPMYFRGAVAAVLVYDITSEESFQNVQSWVKELRQSGPDSIMLAVAGNKRDRQKERKVGYSQGQFYADQLNAIFMETSAKTGENVENLFIKIARALPLESIKQPEKTLQTRHGDKAGKRRSSCCN